MHPGAGGLIFGGDHLAAEAHCGQAVERLGQALCQHPQDAGSQAPRAAARASRLLISLVIIWHCALVDPGSFSEHND